MNPFSLYAARHQADSPGMVQGPTYPTQSTCWCCGATVFGQPLTSLRSCSNGHEEVRWNERLPDVPYERKPGNERTLFTSCP